MKNTNISLLLFVIVVISTQVEGWIGLLEYDGGNYTSHCFTTRNNLGEMKKNEVKRLEGLCAQATCRDDRSIYFQGCAPLAAKPPCEVVEGDINKPFPDCCYEIRCDIKENQIR